MKNQAEEKCWMILRDGELPAKVKVLRDRTAFIDDIENLLAFPNDCLGCSGNPCLPLWNHYSSRVLKTWHNGPYLITSPPHPVNLAWAVLQYEDCDERIRELAQDENRDEDELSSLIFNRCKLLDFALMFNEAESLNSLCIGMRNGEEESILKVARVDKSLIATDWLRQYIIEKQYRGDWDFFERLGKALAKRPLKDQPYMLRAFVVVAYLWDEHFSKMPYPDMLSVLKENKVLPKNTPLDTFRRMLNRRGLKKSRYNRK